VIKDGEIVCDHAYPLALKVNDDLLPAMVFEPFLNISLSRPCGPACMHNLAVDVDIV
jgi:hypothetical protein